MEDQVEHLTDINDFLKKDWENSLQEVVELKIKVDQREKEIEKLHKHYDNKLEKQKRTYENKIKGLEHQMRCMERHTRNNRRTVEPEIEIKSKIIGQLQD